MKKIQLILATIIGLAGLVVYFITIPTINEESLVDIRVEAGEEEVFDDVILSGFLYDFDNFIVHDNNVTTLQNLPYLERADAHYYVDMYLKQQKHPEFMDIVMYQQNNSDYLLLDSSEYLLAASLQYDDDNQFQIDSSKLHLTLLDKATDKITVNEVDRQNTSNGDQVSVKGLYMSYPNIYILYDTMSWDDGYTGFEESTLSYGVYNSETKNYNERIIFNDEGSFFDAQAYNAIVSNKYLMIFDYYGIGDMPADTKYLFNFIEGSFEELDDSLGTLYIDESSNIYELTSSEDNHILRQYNDTADEVTNEVILELEEPVNLQNELSPISFHVVDEKVYLIKNQYQPETEKDILPTLFQVFDLNSGENLSHGEIHYDIDGEVNAIEGSIDYISQTSP